jgi:hypothetical protein
MISEKAKQLIPKARIVSFASWQSSYSDKVIQIFQHADEGGRYLSEQDIEEIKALVPHLATGLGQAQLLRDKAAEIVVQAREKVLEKFPSIVEPGGELYPPERAEACWRDFWHFLRCITYGIAGNNYEFTSQEGLENMRLLYQELQVPLPAMIYGLENLEILCLREFKSEYHASLKPYFEHLIQALKQF